ncbi:MAG: hypothetical protein JXR58_08885 [Bacteroidales bacterium]|nr:hypothetical protein [Bacteroidales bacterium]
MNDFLEILKYTIPSLIVFATAYYIILRFMKNEEDKRRFEAHQGSRKLVTPIRLQAYERITLFLERLSPETQIRNLSHPTMKAHELRNDMVNLIKAEFEHNLVQQVYMSVEAWQIVKSAQENTIKLINECAKDIKPEAPALELGKEIIERAFAMEQAPNQVALDFIKKEVSRLFNY